MIKRCVINEAVCCMCVHMNAGYYIFGERQAKDRQAAKLPTKDAVVGGLSVTCQH